MGIYSLCDVMVYTKDKTRNTELQAGLDNFRKHIPQREKTQNNEKKTYRKKTKTNNFKNIEIGKNHTPFSIWIRENMSSKCQCSPVSYATPVCNQRILL